MTINCNPFQNLTYNKFRTPYKFIMNNKGINSFFKNLSIKKKVILLIESTLILIILISMLIIIPLIRNLLEEQMKAKTVLASKLLGEYAVTPLMYKDKEGAKRLLLKLNSVQNIKNARLYDKQNDLFAVYNRNNKPFTIPDKEHSNRQIINGYLHVYEKITFENEPFGSIYVRASDKEIDKTMNTLYLPILFITLGLLIVAYFIAYQEQKLISKPILRLANAIQKITEKEDYSIRVNKEQENEIGDLIGGFNIMLSRIEYYIKALEHNNQELEEFNYVASHDLKEPLRTLISYCNLLEEDLQGELPEDAKEDVEFIKNASERMNHLIQDLLELSRAGREELNFKNVDLNRVVESVTSDLKARINEKHGTIKYKDLPTVKADTTQLTRVVENLVSNALKFHGKENPVVNIEAQEITAMDQNGKQIKQWKICISDNGIGIKPDYLHKIFAPFKRLHNVKKYEGTGIGLSICKKIIERSGGKIWAESEIGKGTQFYFTLNQV